jgi:hypothetical protein
MVPFGVVFAVIGVIVLIPSVVYYSMAADKIQQCSTLLGQLNQLDVNTAEF